MRIALFCALSLGVLVAEEPKDAAGWVAELSAARSRLRGQIVFYRSKGENKELNATIGTDQASGRFAMVVKASSPNGNFELHSWNTEEGDLFVDDNGKRVRMLSLEKTFEFLVGFAKLVPSSVSSSVDFSPVPMLLLTRDSVEGVVRLGKSKAPDWALQAGDELSLKEVTPEHVVFTSATYGDLTIDRANGILVRQELKGAEGEARILERVEFQEIGDATKVVAMSRNWSELGAVDGGLTQGSMTSILEYFQRVIAWVEEGQIGIEQLEQKMSSKDEVREFAKTVLLRNKRPVQSPISWEKIIGIARAELKKQWAAEFPDADPDDNEAFTDYLTEPKNRKSVREDLAVGLTSLEGVLPIVMPGIWGPKTGDGLKADSATTREAKKIIETALCRAYFDVMLDEKMAESWGERKGLD